MFYKSLFKACAIYTILFEPSKMKLFLRYDLGIIWNVLKMYDTLFIVTVNVINIHMVTLLHSISQMQRKIPITLFKIWNFNL